MDVGHDDDDVLRYLHDPVMPGLLGLPEPVRDESPGYISDPMLDPAMWDVIQRTTNDLSLLAVNPSEDNVNENWGGDDIDLSGWHAFQEPGYGVNVEEGGNGGLGLEGNDLDCSGCYVLREVVHTNGLQSMKLAIHGGIGNFYHALIENQYNSDGFQSDLERSYVDLSDQGFECVKQYLTDYALLRSHENFYVMQDSLSAFIDALSTTMSYEVTSTSTPDPCLPEPGFFQPGSSTFQPETSTLANGATRTHKTGMAAQRERTGKLHIRDLSRCFHLPIAVACKELNLCATALKKICRRHGMGRWPHRKIKSIDKRISKLLRQLYSGPDEGAGGIQAEIERLKARRARIYDGLSP